MGALGASLELQGYVCRKVRSHYLFKNVPAGSVRALSSSMKKKGVLSRIPCVFSIVTFNIAFVKPGQF